MKVYHLLIIAVLLVSATALGWFFGSRRQGPTEKSTSTAAERKVLYYQSPMHPWIKSNQPGKCTICGMDLTPVYEGQQGFSASSDTVVLSSNAITVAGVQSEPAARRNLTRQLRLAGSIDDNDSTHRVLSSYVEGRIEQLYISFTGAEVIQGQPLVRIYSPTLLTAEREYVSLFKQQSSASAASRPELVRLQNLAAVRLQRLGLTTNQIQSLPDKPEGQSYSELLAPVSGTVVTRDIYAGQFVREGDKLFELADFSTMWLKLEVYERDLPWLKVGQSVTATTPSLPHRTWTAPISFIDPNLNDQTRSAQVRIEIPNPLVTLPGESQPRREILHRLYVQATVECQIPDVLSVPRSAVLATTSEPMVYLDLGEGHYQSRPVKTGRAGDQHWEILDGLQSGDKVVTQAAFLLDAQSQIHRSPAASHAPTNTPTTPQSSLTPASTPMTSQESEALSPFLKATHDLTRSLAQDQTNHFQHLFSTWAQSVQTLTNNLRSDWWNTVPFQPALAQVHLPAPSSLKEARERFHPASVAAASLVRSIEKTTGTRPARLFQCPMTGKAFPNAPKTAPWIQLDATIMNPYYGAEMLDCGTEVKP